MRERESMFTKRRFTKKVVPQARSVQIFIGSKLIGGYTDLINYFNTSRMFEYSCKLVKVIDGDTIDIDMNLGFGVWLH